MFINLICISWPVNALSFRIARFIFKGKAVSGGSGLKLHGCVDVVSWELEVDGVLYR